MAELSDKELQSKLIEHGCVVGPITDSTRRVYVAKLHSLENKGTAISPRSNESSHVAGGVARAPRRVPKLIHKKDWEQDYKKSPTVEGTLTVLESTISCQSSPPSTLPSPPSSSGLSSSPRPSLPSRPAAHCGPCRAEGMAESFTHQLAAPPTSTDRKCSPSHQ